MVVGPGARSGLRKCFMNIPAGSEEQVIHWVCQTQEFHFGKLGVEFPYLRGRRLQPIDCQNLFCEVDKYTRVSHPELVGLGRRTRIKQVFRSAAARMIEPLFYPPKWEVALSLPA